MKALSFSFISDATTMAALPYLGRGIKQQGRSLEEIGTA
jgi:hypothetical protein